MNVQLPDGSVVQFPDGMPNDQVNSAISGYLGQAGAPAPIQSQDTIAQAAQPSTDMDRIGYGMQAPVNGISQDMLHAAQYLPDSVLNAIPGLRGSDQYMDTDLAQQEAQYQAARKAAGSNGFDWDKTLGSMISTAPLAAVAPAGDGALLAQGLKGAATGGVFGAIQPVTGGGDDYASQKGAQIGTGALTGGILTPAMGAVGGLISPQVTPEARALLEEGITPTVGQMLGGGFKSTEDKLTSVPLLGDAIKGAQTRSLEQFNSAALARALAPIGETTSNIGRQGIDDVATKLGNAYDEVLPRMTLPLDDGFASAVQDAKAGLQPAQATTFDNIMSNQFNKFGDAGSMTGDTLKGFQSEIKNEASGYGSDASYDQRKLGAALDNVHQALGDALERANPNDAAQLQAINQGYANYVPLRRAGQMVKEDGPFTPNQLAMAIRGEDNTVGNGAFARGNARMQDLSDAGVSTLANKFPESGTFARYVLATLPAQLAEGLAHAPVTTLSLAGGGLGATLPYLTNGSQKLAASLLASRPQFAAPLRNVVEGSSPFLTSGAVTNTANQ